MSAEMKKCFKKLCRCAGTAIEKYQLIADGDRILAAVSGGKDSIVMMHILSHLQEVAPVKFTFAAVTFDPGFEGFDTDAIRRYCLEHKWEHHMVSLPVGTILREKDFENAPCVLCSRLRRGKLYGLAKELGFNKLALGQHLDDIAESFLMSLCRGQGVTTMAPKSAADNPEHPEIIRIMALAPESLVAEFASFLELPSAGECPYHDQLKNSGDRAYFKNLVTQLASHIPDVRSNIAKSLSHIELEHLMVPPEIMEQK